MPTATAPITLPVVHLNGTGRQRLLDDYYNAYKALKAAYETVATIEFNARDYYPISDSAYRQARTERDAQLTALYGAIQYIEAHVNHLA